MPSSNRVRVAVVNERVFRTVREVNEALPPDQRIRVVLGDPDVDFSTIRGAVDRDQLPGPGHLLRRGRRT
jgi:hypothetical protein